MVFSSMIFLWGFLPVVFIGNFVCYKIGSCRLANILLLAASIFFYTWGEPEYIILMLASVAVNWIASLLLELGRYQKIILLLAVAVNLGLLAHYKYAGLIVQTINTVFHCEIPIPVITLPIGISFFTFQALSYVVDVYRGECRTQKNIFKLALYISFFPQLIAGPIIKYKDVCRQIDHRQLSLEQTAAGIRRFTYGLGKKVLISNILGLCVDQIYGENMLYISTSMAWFAAFAYMFQIYYDFSGYSDMAIGLGKMFGFEFEENFRYPYTSLSIREFWRRWHISLGSWFREYVYIPLGGSRKGTVKTCRNLLTVFMLTGIWHGADYTFLVWGLYHGFFLVLERVGFGNLLKRSKAISFVYTFFAVNIGWILFRADNFQMAGEMIRRMFLPGQYLSTARSLWEYTNLHTVFVLLIAVLGMGFIQRQSERYEILNKWKHSIPEFVFCVSVFALSLMSIASNTYNPFIYFRF